MEDEAREFSIVDFRFSIRDALTSLGIILLLLQSPAMASEEAPSFLHGAGQVMGGLLFELPKTVFTETLDGPPVVGTAVGLLAGTARALQVTAAGFVEMARGFDPWGAKRRS